MAIPMLMTAASTTIHTPIISTHMATTVTPTSMGTHILNPRHLILRNRGTIQMSVLSARSRLQLKIPMPHRSMYRSVTLQSRFHSQQSKSA